MHASESLLLPRGRMDKERVPAANATAHALSPAVRRLHAALNQLLSEDERARFVHCVRAYQGRRNVLDLSRTLLVLLDSPRKRRLLPLLRQALPRADQLLFDLHTSEGLYLPPRAGACACAEPDDGDPTLRPYVNDLYERLCATGARTVTLVRARSREGLGFSVRGGAEHGVRVHVSLVEPDSPAERAGLRLGDRIHAANGVRLDRLTHAEAVQVLKSPRALTLSVSSLSLSWPPPLYSWVDLQGRAVSPPPPEGPGPPHSPPHRTVALNMEDGRPLGLMVRGGAEYGLGVFISGVDPGSAADVGELQVGDQILEVNGQSFVSVSHDDAVSVLRSSARLLLTVRQVGRLPHAQVPEWAWLPPAEDPSGGPEPNGTRPTSARAPAVSSKPAGCRVGVAPPGTPLTLDQQAYLLLTGPEQQTLTYYLQEYLGGRIGVEPLTAALLELFNTPAKVSMLSEVRTLVDPSHQDAFDRQVQLRQGGVQQTWLCPPWQPAPAQDDLSSSSSACVPPAPPAVRPGRPELSPQPSARVLPPTTGQVQRICPLCPPPRQGPLPQLSVFASPPAGLPMQLQRVCSTPPGARPPHLHKPPPLSRSAPSSAPPSSAASPVPFPPTLSPRLTVRAAAAAAAAAAAMELPGLPSAPHRGGGVGAERPPPPPRDAATLSQLSDSGQTLSEDSGVDIAESGAKDGGVRHNHGLQSGTPPMMQRGVGQPQVSSPVLARAPKHMEPLCVTVAEEAGTRQRVVTIQAGGSTHSGGQLRGRGHWMEDGGAAERPAPHFL